MMYYSIFDFRILIFRLYSTRLQKSHFLPISLIIYRGFIDLIYNCYIRSNGFLNIWRNPQNVSFSCKLFLFDNKRRSRKREREKEREREREREKKKPNGQDRSVIHFEKILSKLSWINSKVLLSKGFQPTLTLQGWNEHEKSRWSTSNFDLPHGFRSIIQYSTFETDTFLSY